MKDRTLYIARVVYNDMITGGYFIGLNSLKNALLKIVKNNPDVIKVEYAKAPYMRNDNVFNGDKSTLVVVYEREVK